MSRNRSLSPERRNIPFSEEYLEILKKKSEKEKKCLIPATLDHLQAF